MTDLMEVANMAENALDASNALKNRVSALEKENERLNNILSQIYEQMERINKGLLENNKPNMVSNLVRQGNAQMMVTKNAM